MTKRDFERKLNTLLKDLPLEEKEHILQEMENIWISEIKREMEEKHLDKKEEFKKFIIESLNDLSEKERNKIFEKVKDKWLPSIQENFKERIRGRYIKCPECGKYSLYKRFEYTTKDELRKCEDLSPSWTFWEDHVFADVYYRVHYRICPCCGHEIEYDKTTLKVTNKHDKYGNPVK